MATTPDEFLQFAQEMGLGQVKPTSLTELTLSNDDNNSYTLTGLSALNNLCHLMEDIHRLRAENERLRAHLDLITQTEKFLLKTEENNKVSNRKEKKLLRSSTLLNEGNGEGDGDKSTTVSPSNSLKIKKELSSTLSLTNRSRQGSDYINNNEDLSSNLHIDNSLAVPNSKNWNRVRHVFSFSLRRKTSSPSSPQAVHTDRTIPSISISNENDDDNLSNSKDQTKRRINSLKNDNRQGSIGGEDTDQDDEYTENNRIDKKREFYRTDRTDSSSYERPESSASNLFTGTSTGEDENALRRKSSKIAHYRRKLRSKLDTVKKTFSDPNPSLIPRALIRPQGSTFDEIGSGLNHALLTAQLATAMTKSYQQKMREWHTMQKSNFLVDYRRQSITSKTDPNDDSRRPSVISTIRESSNEPRSSTSEASDLHNQTNTVSLSPTLSPNQRSLLVHQWREIMSEEIYLRYYSEYLQNKIQQIKRLETDLKSLKTSIFYPNNQDRLVKHHSITSFEQCNQNIRLQYKQLYIPQRSHSFQSLISMPHSWILAVQSAAYSDILDGTSIKSTERAVLFNKNFFHQLKHIRDDRQQFEQDMVKDLSDLKNSKTNLSQERNSFGKTSPIPQPKQLLLSRKCLRKLSLVSPNEIPRSTISNPEVSFIQTKINVLETSSHIDLLPTPTYSETDSTNILSSSGALNKRSKRSRFDFRKTLQRSKSMCMTQFNSWFQRHRSHQHRQQHQTAIKSRRRSTLESKTPKETMSSSCSTPKLLGSPRLARLHQRIFKRNHSPPLAPPVNLQLQSLSLPGLAELHAASTEPLDDSDERFQNQEAQVRIYLPARTPSLIRRVRITDDPTPTDNNIKPTPMAKITSPIFRRRNLQSAIKTKTYGERQHACTDL